MIAKAPAMADSGYPALGLGCMGAHWRTLVRTLEGGENPKYQALAVIRRAVRRDGMMFKRSSSLAAAQPNWRY